MGRPGVLLAGDKFSCAFGMGTGPAAHLPCQESSSRSMNVTSVLVHSTGDKPVGVCAVCPGLALGERLQGG